MPDTRDLIQRLTEMLIDWHSDDSPDIVKSFDLISEAQSYLLQDDSND